MASSEDVLLQVKHVRYKKNNGTLYVMSERVGWMMENSDTFVVSHRYADIKLQKISPEGKPKIQLQIVLHDGGTSTFQFSSPGGLQVQLQERDQVKEILQQLLPRFKRRLNRELEEKNRLLSQNPTLLRLYHDLVASQVITSEEFWSSYAQRFLNSQQTTQAQDVGVSGAFLVDIKPQTDGCNGLKYNLTAELMEAIFKTYPVVRAKHSEYVPHKIPEQEFWTRFFQSHYFHRDRLSTTSKDLFAECAKHDDQELRKAAQAGVSNPLVDLQGFEDKSLDEAYGMEADKAPKAGVNIVHQNIIKRFNQHNIMVMQACDTSSNSRVGGVNDSLDKVEKNTENKSEVIDRLVDGEAAGEGCSPSAKRRALAEKTEYEDLGSVAGKTVNSSEHRQVPLTLTRPERYCQAPTATTTLSSSSAPPPPSGRGPVLSLEETLSSAAAVRQQVETWGDPRAGGGGVGYSSMPLLSSHFAGAVVGSLTPGGALMSGFRGGDSLSQLVGAELEQEVRNLYASVCELLRHFWACFPPTTPSLEEKAMKMHEALRRFATAKVRPLEEKLLREHVPASILRHLNQLLNSAFIRFASWQQKKQHAHR